MSKIQADIRTLNKITIAFPISRFCLKVERLSQPILQQTLKPSSKQCALIHFKAIGSRFANFFRHFSFGNYYHRLDILGLQNFKGIHGKYTIGFRKYYQTQYFRFGKYYHCLDILGLQNFTWKIAS